MYKNNANLEELSEADCCRVFSCIFHCRNLMTTNFKVNNLQKTMSQTWNLRGIIYEDFYLKWHNFREALVAMKKMIEIEIVS